MKTITTCLFILLATVCRAQELTADANTLLLLHFNNSVNGAAGETPLISSNITYDVGRFGQALKCNANTVLKFDTTQNINTKQGTIEFWIKPDVGGDGVILDMRTTNGLIFEVGFYTSMTLNTMPANPNPEVVVLSINQSWFPGTWYHLAFTWGNGQLKMYVNGRFFKSTSYNFEPSPVPLTYFSIGSYYWGAGHFLGLIDELRISNVPRSSGEICQDYLQGWGSFQTIDVSPASITLYKGWSVNLEKPLSYQYPKVIARNGNDSTILGGGCINWTVSDPSVLEIDYNTLTLKAIGSGSSTSNLIGTVGGITFNIPVIIKLPVLPEERVQVIDPFLAKPASCYTKLMPTVAYIYLPTLDGINIDVNEISNVPQTLSLAKQRILEMAKFTKFSLEEGSKFRGYQNPDAKPYVGYQIVEYVFVYEPLPRGIRNDPTWYADFNQIIKRFNGKKMVDTLGVREVWLFGYDIGEIGAVESNMSSPTTGDISNSFMIQDDLPIYNNTYIVYNYNIQRAGNEAVHNHGHQFEAMINYVDHKQNGSEILSTQKFRGYGSNVAAGPLGRVGDTHHPPNTRVDYDYCNSTLVASDIFDWKPEGGTTTLVNCNTWTSIPYQWPAGVSHDANSNWFILWMQSFMGNGNQIQYGSRWMTNWWKFISNWDSTTVKIGLHQANQETNQGCTAAINSGLPVTSVCSGGSFSVNYFGNGVTFNAGNIFTVQLSDATGSFSNPVNIGTLNSTSANGSINVAIPSITALGNNYLIRVNSSNPSLTGSGLSSLSIKSIPSTPAITAGSAIIFCTGGSVTLTSNAASGNQWYKDGVSINGSTGTTLIASASGSYTTKVTLNGCESTVSNAIVVTVNSIPATPTISAGTATTFCTGGSVTLTSNAASGNQWYKDGVAINSATSSTLNVTTSGSYTVKVTLSGCVSTVSNAIVVTVNPIPPTPVITAGTTTTFCTGVSVILTSNAANGNQWYKDGVAISSATNNTLNATSSGSYTVKVTLSGCESVSSNAIAVTVNPIPSTPIITAGSAITFCTGGTVTLTSNAASGNQWNKDGVAINSATSISLNATTSGSYTTKVTLSGCVSAASNAIVVTVNPVPSTPVISAGATTTFCSGGSLTLTSNAASGNQWFKDGAAISGSTGTTLNVTANGSYTTKVTLNGCESVVSNAIVVTVNPIPSTPIITAGSAITFCTGGIVTLTSNAASGNQWFKDGVAINSATSTTLNANTSGSYTVKVTLSGCVSAASNAIVVTVNPIPSTPTITAATTTTFCTGGSVTLTSNAASGNQWFKDGVAVSGSTGTSLNITTGGSYTSKVTSNGCESPASNAIAVTVNTIPPKPAISRNGADMLSSATSGNQWFIDGVSISGATSPTYRPSASGQISVQATINNCISPMSDNYYFLITGIVDPAALENFIHVFPNPVTNKLSIVSNYQHPLQIRILDITGRSYYKLTKASGTTEIDMSRYTAGSYLLVIKDSKTLKSFRKLIVKQY